MNLHTEIGGDGSEDNQAGVSSPDLKGRPISHSQQDFSANTNLKFSCLQRKSASQTVVKSKWVNCEKRMAKCLGTK